MASLVRSSWKESVVGPVATECLEQRSAAGRSVSQKKSSLCLHWGGGTLERFIEVGRGWWQGVKEGVVA